MEQKVLSGYKHDNFHGKLNNFLKDGWLVVGGITTSMESYTWTPHGGYDLTEKRSYYTAIIQKEE